MVKPKLLKSPFTWETRCPTWVDPVLFVPERYEAHSAFTCPPLFSREAPTYVEYCSGNGDWVVEKARLRSDCNWIAVEKRFERVRKIWSKRKNQGIDNLAVVSGEALPFSQYYVAPHSISGCFINFPDPWPKGRHAKHRIFQPPFLEALASILILGAHATIVTDDPLWAERIVEAFLTCPAFLPVSPPPYFITEWPEYGTSYFDSLWRSKAKTIHYISFVRNPECV